MGADTLNAFSFDPWAALELRRRGHPPAKAPNPANLSRQDGPGLGGLAGLAGVPPSVVKLQGGGLRTMPAMPTPTVAPIPAALVPWHDGAIRLQATSPPAGFSKARWMRAGLNAARLVENNGAALQAAGWDTLDLFGVHRFVPGTRPDCTFRDAKDLRFGMGMGAIRVSTPDRRDRIWLLNALASALLTLLTLLGAAGEALGYDRHLKSNTTKRRTHSLFRQGCLLYELIPPCQSTGC